MMSTVSFGRSGRNTPAVSEKIVASTLNAIQQLLPESKIAQICAEAQYAWRDRVLSPAGTVLHMSLAAIWPKESFHAGWQVQWAAVASRHPERAGRSPWRGSVAEARARLPLALWEKLLAYVSETAQARGEAFVCWRGHRVVLLDGTCVSLPAGPALFDAFRCQHGLSGRKKVSVGPCADPGIAPEMVGRIGRFLMVANRRIRSSIARYSRRGTATESESGRGRLYCVTRLSTGSSGVRIAVLQEWPVRHGRLPLPSSREDVDLHGREQ